MVCMSEVTEWEIPLEKIENKMEKKIILVHEDTCVHQRTPLIYTLNKNTLYLGGLQMWTIEKYFCGTSTKKYWTLVGAVTNNRKYSHIWKLCLWHPLNDNQTYFILSNNQIWHFLYCSKHSCPLVSEGDWFHDPSQQKQSSGTHKFSRQRPDVFPFAWQSKEAILLYFTPPKDPYSSFVF